MGLVVFSFLSFQTKVQAQERDSTAKLTVLPLIFYSPETKFGFGAASIYTFQLPNSTLQSQAQLGFAYTSLKQVLLYTPFQVFSEKYRLEGELGYYRYTYKFFGIGAEVAKTHEEDYDVSFPRLRAELYRAYKNIYTGLAIDADYYKVTQLDSTGILHNEKISGFEGMQYIGIGPSVIFDTRNDNFYPNSGYLVNLKYSYYPKFAEDFQSFNKVQFNATKYASLGKAVLASQIGFEQNRGDIPFVQFAGLGGSKLMRGYYADRFRDRNATYLQSEYRYVPQRVGFTLFASLGWVSQDFESLAIKESIYTYGAGFRYQLQKEKKVNLRVDMGWNQLGKVNFYVTVLEAF